jgi:hypothetical protein
MTLADLRKLAIRKRTRIRFSLRNGMECVITEKGVAQVPALKARPEFNLEEELAVAGSFALESAEANAGAKTVGRTELAHLTHEGGSPAARHDDHEEQ